MAELAKIKFLKASLSQMLIKLNKSHLAQKVPRGEGNSQKYKKIRNEVLGSPVFDLVSTVLMDLAEEELHASSFKGCASAEIERALGNDTKLLSAINIPSYHHLCDLVL